MAQIILNDCVWKIWKLVNLLNWVLVYITQIGHDFIALIKITMLTKNLSILCHVWTLEPSVTEQSLSCVLTIQHWGQHRISANIRTPAHQYHIFWKLHDIGKQLKFYIKYVTIACLNYPKHGGIDFGLWQLTWFLNILYFDSYYFSLS